MAIQTIQLKRGNSENFQSVTLTAGEPAFTTDDGKLYVGNGVGNKILINPDIVVSEGLESETLPSGAISIKIQDVGGEIDLGWIKVNEKGQVVELSAPAVQNITGLLLNNKIDPTLIPELAITRVAAVESIEEMLELDAETGDVAIVNCADQSAAGNYIMQGSDPANIDHWAKLIMPNTVTKESLGLEKVTNESKAEMFTDPVFTGDAAHAPTPDVDDVSDKVATTKFVDDYAQDKGFITSEDIVIIDGGTF